VTHSLIPAAPMITAASAAAENTIHSAPRPKPYSPNSPRAGTGSSSPKPKSRFVKETDVEDESGWDVVYTDGSCTNNGGPGAKAGIGVWWGHNDPRSVFTRTWKSLPDITLCS
jgi:hypothetical protein